MNDPGNPERRSKPRRWRRRFPPRGKGNPAHPGPSITDESTSQHREAGGPDHANSRPRERAQREAAHADTRGKTELSVIVPLVNEADSLEELHQKIGAALRDLRLRAEIIFIDDGSLDRSFEILSEIQRRDQRVRVIQFRRNFGKSAALAAGFRRAHGGYIVTMDADLQDDPAEIKSLLGELHKGYDLISGWKRNRKDPFVKRFTSKIFNLVTNWFTGLRLHDINCGLKIYRREVTQSVHVYGELHRFLPVLAHQVGFRVGEIVVQHHPRKYGRSKFGLSRFSKGFFDLLTVLFLTRYTKRPLHLFGVAGLIAFVLGFGITAYLAIEKLFLSRFLSNRPLLFLGLLLMIIGVQAVSIGLLGEMITAATPQAPFYFVKRELGFNKR
ncbi:MAG: glycosyltransferase family 2 protein [bacterium]